MSLMKVVDGTELTRLRECLASQPSGNLNAPLGKATSISLRRRACRSAGGSSDG